MTTLSLIFAGISVTTASYALILSRQAKKQAHKATRQAQEAIDQAIKAETVAKNNAPIRPIERF